MKHMMPLLLIFAGLVALNGCQNGSHVSASLQVSGADIVEQHESSPETFPITGTVTYVAIEGGFFAITGDDGKTYDPLNLPDSLKIDGLKIQCTAREKEDVVGFHMYGIMIEILDITVR